MSYYGFTVTNKGRDLIAKLVAGETFQITRIMVGEGVCSEETAPRFLEDLVIPVAAATSTKPIYEGNSVQFTVEYRSDMNGGLDEGFWLSEFGVFAYDPDLGEILLYYGTLGDYPQYVSAGTSEGIDVRRFPVCIAIGADLDLKLDYDCTAWVTEDDMQTYCTVTMLPQFLNEALKLIDEHDKTPTAHQYILNLIQTLSSRISLIELLNGNSLASDGFSVTFDFTGVSGEVLTTQINDEAYPLSIAGVRNAEMNRIEF